MSPDERDELDAEILNEINNFKSSKRPYLEEIKIANCNLL